MYSFSSFIRDYVNHFGNTVVEGRDIGTIVFPNANLKFFLTVSDETAAKRRFEQLKKNDSTIVYEQILEDIRTRNLNDKNRAIAPLIKSNDAIEISTDDKTEIEVVEEIMKIVETRTQI